MDESSYNWLLSTIKTVSEQAAMVMSHGTLSESFPQEATMQDTPEQILKNVFGYDSFRPLQREVIQNVLDGRDTLAVMPTGGGKSLCYEIPALMLNGLTVVVSPLIALMQDQVTQLKSTGIPAVFINSSLDWDTYRDTCSHVRSGEIKLLYVSPEGLNSPRLQDLLHSENVSLQCITIDEAHCISEWGHDFRPDYMEIASIREQFPRAVCLALTATATSTVRKDIIKNLHMENPAVLVASFNRPNLFLEVRRKVNPQEQVIDFLQGHKNQSGIIYCFSRKQVDELTAFLKSRGFSALNYHAGLSDEERSSHQNDFIYDKVDIMVATVAFGMGINKPDVRFVIHYDMPKSIEQYYQEIGRAGRDGLNASAMLLYSLADIHKIRYFFTDKEDPQQAERLLQGMIQYAQTKVCRRQFLLSYFGEHYGNELPAAQCCDVCARGPIDSKDVTIPTQKYLSCILRTRERYGASYVIDVLMGSKSKRILENGDNKLSTWGIGKDLSKQDWLELNTCLLDAGYLDRTEEHSVLYLTPFGRQALMERREILLPVEFSASKKSVQGFPKPSKKPVYLIADDDEEGIRIAEDLRKWRRFTAEEMNVPPYVIFGDKTLFDIASKKPRNKAELSNCYGIGISKSQNFGDDILRIVRDE